MRFIQKNRRFLLMTAGCVGAMFAVFALTIMTSEGGWGIYLLLLLCPALHFLMHRGMRADEHPGKMLNARLPKPEKEASVEEHSGPAGLIQKRRAR